MEKHAWKAGQLYKKGLMALLIVVKVNFVDN